MEMISRDVIREESARPGSFIPTSRVPGTHRIGRRLGSQSRSRCFLRYCKENISFFFRIKPLQYLRERHQIHVTPLVSAIVLYSRLHSRETRLLPSSCLSAYISASPTVRISVKFNISALYENLSRKPKSGSNRGQKYWTLYVKT
jgi:hypothetical protein